MNAVKIIVRTLRKQKGYSLINVACLAVGMACFILILLWVHDELDYDRFNTHTRTIYRIIHERHFTDQTVHSAVTPPPLGPMLKQEIPEIIHATRYGTFVGEIVLEHEDNAFYEDGGAYVDPDFFEIFSFSFLSGNPGTALDDRYSIVLTRSLAEKYFGDQNPIGQNLILEDVTTLTVTGVLEDVPLQSHLKFDFLVPFILYEAWGADLNDWQGYPQYTYIRLREQAVQEDVSGKISQILQRFELMKDDRLRLQPLKRIHLFSDLAYDNVADLGDIRTVTMIAAIALFILIIACINFINLATARAINRAREIGLRKAVGGSRFDLIRQFFGESFVSAWVAFLLALVLVEVFLPTLNLLSGKNLSFVLHPGFLLSMVGVVLFTGLVSGSYPAIHLSSFRPADALRQNRTGSEKQAPTLRRILVLLQFAFSTGLIICTIILYHQLRFIQNTSLGFSKDHIIYIQSRAGLRDKFPSFKSELLRLPNILSLTATSNVTGAVPATSSNVDWEGKSIDENQVWGFLFVYYDYFKTMNIDLIDGRAFSSEIPTDATQAFIVNEEAAKLIHAESPVGLNVGMGDRSGTIIGVAKDFHFNSLHTHIRPLVVQIRPEYCNYLLIRIRSADRPNTIRNIETTWNRFMPHFPFRYRFLDDTIDQMYRIEMRLGRILTVFTLLALIISCLGLFGLASYTTEQRTKEIGIRKVFGASTRKIVILLSKEFTKWVLAANVLAWPIAYIVMKQFLETYAYRIDIGLWVFIFSTAIALIIALVTVSYQSIRAAVSNPVKSLRYE